ncbi:PPC domain-containing protein [Pseudoalteromonas distincta]|uniref:PPC domain-containing protein n=1 Tax=Pseudoalteromonas distincta TaxID=77608 RepID=UPI0023407683|nr:PPC domain-containing protein [Pseudoalteromonas distincta]MDC3214797.1 PPC domain-containing protein [Pseudoalteromonas distincta]
MPVQAKTIQSPPPVGTWQNKDEDGDGVPDEQDDYPFDANLAKAKYHQETELNDNLAKAENLTSEIPYFVSGVVQHTADLDLFKFTTNKAERVSVVLNTTNSIFRPNIFIFNSTGSSVEEIKSNFTAIGNIGGAASNFTLPAAGTYYLAITDDDARGNTDFSYKAKLFFDVDIDYIDDGLEPAFGLIVDDIDSDKDRIFDGTEFYVYLDINTYSHDVDLDGIPNWLDDDSDADGIPDKIEGVSDQDQDGLGNFVDLDSDGNGNVDKNEVKDILISFPADTDGDRVPNYADVDDDNDGLLDLNDANPLKIVDSTFPGEADYKEISTINYIFKGQSYNGLFVENGTHKIKGRGLDTEGILVFKRAKNLPPINKKVPSIQDVTFVLPEYTQSLFYFAKGKRSNSINVNKSNRNLPLVLKPKFDYYSVGDTVGLSGQHFSDDMLVFINDIEVKPSIKNEEKLTFVVPDGASSEARLTAKTTYGTSNTVAINIGDEVFLDYSQLNIPNEVLAPLLVTSLKTPTNQEEYVGDDLNINYFFGGVSDVVMSLYIDENGRPHEFINTVVFQADKSIVITPIHIAASTVWYSGALGNNIEQGRWKETFKTISSNEDVKVFANFIESNLSNPRFIDDNSPNYQSMLNKAIASSKNSISN